MLCRRLQLCRKPESFPVDDIGLVCQWMGRDDPSVLKRRPDLDLKFYVIDTWAHFHIRAFGLGQNSIQTGSVKSKQVRRFSRRRPSLRFINAENALTV